MHRTFTHRHSSWTIRLHHHHHTHQMLHTKTPIKPVSGQLYILSLFFSGQGSKRETGNTHRMGWQSIKRSPFIHTFTLTGKFRNVNRSSMFLVGRKRPKTPEETHTHYMILFVFHVGHHVRSSSLKFLPCPWRLAPAQVLLLHQSPLKSLQTIHHFTCIHTPWSNCKYISCNKPVSFDLP